MQSQILWAGHAVHLSDCTLPKIIFYGKIKNGTQSQGGQKKHFKDTLKILKSFGIDRDANESGVQD